MVASSKEKKFNYVNTSTVEITDTNTSLLHIYFMSIFILSTTLVVLLADIIFQIESQTAYQNPQLLLYNKEPKGKPPGCLLPIEKNATPFKTFGLDY